MDRGLLAASAETHLNDLQAELEAGSRRLDHIHDQGERIRDALFTTQMEQAARMGSLVERIGELVACVKQQRAMMRELRHDIRELRASLPR